MLFIEEYCMSCNRCEANEHSHVVAFLDAQLTAVMSQDDISEAAVLMETLRPAFQEAIDNAHK